MYNPERFPLPDAEQRVRTLYRLGELALAESLIHQRMIMEMPRGIIRKIIHPIQVYDALSERERHGDDLFYIGFMKLQAESSLKGYLPPDYLENSMDQNWEWQNIRHKYPEIQSSTEANQQAV
jgi:hypothetical protein